MPTNATSPAASATATLIAGALVLAGRERDLCSLLLPGAAELSARLLAATGRPGVVRTLRFGMFRAVLRAVEGLVLPGIIAHYLARKRALETMVLGALAEEEGGCRQVVVLGAGLDTLAWRLHRQHPEVRWVEVDRPGALRVKAAAMASERGENLILAAADLRRDRPGMGLTSEEAVDPTRRTLFLAEGLLMYLPWARVEELFAESARWGQPPVRWMFTFFERREPGDGGEIDFRRSSRWVNRWLRTRGEPFQWSASAAELAAMLARHGFTIRELWRAADLRERFLRPAGLGADCALAEGEVVCVAEAAGSTQP